MLFISSSSSLIIIIIRMGRKRDVTVEKKSKKTFKNKKPKHQSDPKPFGFNKGIFKKRIYNELLF